MESFDIITLISKKESILWIAVNSNPRLFLKLLSHQWYHNLFQEKVTSRKRSIGLGSGGAGEISDYQVNIMNMAKYVQSFQDRDDVSDKLKTQLKVDCLLITGSKSSSLKACDAMFQCCDKVSTSSYRILNDFNVFNITVIFSSHDIYDFYFKFRHEHQLSDTMT